MTIADGSTILAVASPPGRSARGIVRISGSDAFALIAPAIEIRRGGVTPARLTLLGPDVPCLACCFPGPRSYTGEDGAELQMAGNPILLERVIDGLLEDANRRGLEARRAEPGEFTARAFLAGRMSLTQAEGVAATIAARSDAALRAARFLSGGGLAAFARDVGDTIAACLALVEAGVDFTDEEDVVPITPTDLVARLAPLTERVTGYLAHAVGSEQLDAIPWVVLTGAPNAGKSTLFNALLGHERAVVSALPGTTRDVLTEPLMIRTDHGAAEVMLVDLAGAECANDALAIAMQDRAADAVARAELVLHCVPAGDDVRDAPPRALLVHTKADLADDPPTLAPGTLLVSAPTGRGLEAVRAEIARRLADRAVSLAADAIALQPRHEAALRAANDHLSEAVALAARSEANDHLPDGELVAAALRAALDATAVLIGDVTPDEILGRVFATFCVGK